MFIHALKNSNCFRLLLVITLASSSAVTAFGSDRYLTGTGGFLATYPATVGTKLNSCGVCHINPAGGGTRNAYGIDYANNNHSFASIELLDSDHDGYTNRQEITALTWPGDALDHPADNIPPTITFSLPLRSNTLVVPLTISATDNYGVTGYFVTESTVVPLAGATGWTVSAPPSYTFATAGAKTLRAYAKDGSGNVSASVAASTTITLTDTIAPTITLFTLPANSSSLTVSVTLAATDNVSVTGFFLTESTTVPLAGATGWTVSAPLSYTFTTTGAKTLRAYAKDGAGNVSAGVATFTTITISDTIAPTITSFIIPASSGSLNVSVTLAATDNVAVAGYFVTESVTAPLASATGWTGSAPSSYTFATAGSKTLLAYAKDSVGNVSPGASATTTITSTLTSVSNLIAAHNRTSPQYRRSCSDCHMGVIYEQSLEEPAIHTAHLTMASYVPGRDANSKCRFCHKSVDLIYRSAGNVRRQVDVALCAVCHGPSRPTKQFYQTGSSLTQPDGVALYTLVCSGCHGDLANSQVSGKSASEIQHKIDENEGGMGPLGILTPLEIQAIARALVH
jgi:hypothetical protein